MAWYAYCITERNAFSELGRHRRPMPLTGVTGLFGNQTFLFPAADLAVVVSEHLPEDAAKLVTAEGQSAAREHGVISGCFAKSTVLPFRFGTTFEDDEALRRSVRSNERHFMANVERLRGMAEMHRKGVVDDICPETKGAGRMFQAAGQEYLLHLRESASRQRERQSRARALSLQMHRMFLPVAEEVTCKRMGVGQDAAGYCSPGGKEDRGAVSEQVQHGDAGAEGLRDAAFRALAAVSLCASGAARTRVTGWFVLEGPGDCRGLRLWGICYCGGSRGFPQPSLKSVQSGLLATMRAIFLLRSQPLSSFSRAIPRVIRP